MATPKDKNDLKPLQFLMIGLEKVDLRKAAPITAGDVVALEKSGVQLTKPGGVNIIESGQNLVTYIAHFVRKVKPDASDEQINAIPAAHLVRAVVFIQQESENPPDPN